MGYQIQFAVFRKPIPSKGLLKPSVERYLYSMGIDIRSSPGSNEESDGEKQSSDRSR